MNRILNIIIMAILSANCCFGSDIRLSGAFAQQMGDKDSLVIIFLNETSDILTNKNFSCDIDGRTISKVTLNYEKNSILSERQISLITNYWSRIFIRRKNKPNFNIFSKIIDDCMAVHMLEVPIENAALLPPNMYVMVEGVIHREPNATPEINLMYKTQRL